jgi:hypothetical protein
MSFVKGYAVKVALFLLCAFCALGDYCPPQSRASDGMRDIMLVYATPDKWRQENFRPYVAYLDREGKPQDWFYDAYLFLMYGGAPSGQAYIDGATNRKDWEFYSDEVFAPNREFAALDATIGCVASERRVKAPTVPVIVMIPYPSAKQKDFGDVDGDGVTENLGSDEGRKKVVAWFLRTFIERWERQRFQHVKLWGFYWMNEGIPPPDEAIVKTTAQAVHSLGYKFHWIPWFNAPGVEKWRELGFDLTVMQPNYAFIPPAGLLRVPDENRLTAAANQCRRLGMGIEMELNMGIDMESNRAARVDPRDRINLQLYLDHGDDSLDGYRDGAVRAYYQGYNAIAGLCTSADPALRRLYDDLYQFHKGTYKRFRPYQPFRAAEKCLTDGRWKTRPDARAKAVELSGPSAVLTLPLESPHLAGDVRVHFAGSNAPQRVSLAVGTDPADNGLTEVATEDAVIANPEDGGGFAALTFPVQRTRSLRLKFEMKAGERVAVDEVVLMPAHHLLCGLPYTADPGIADLSRCLTDGVTGGEAMAVWRNGRGEVRFDLPEAYYAETLHVHFRPLGKKAFAPQFSVDLAAGVQAADKEGWAAVTLNRSVQHMVLTVQDSVAGVVAVDEVALLPAKNLAAGCAYTYDPPFRAKYPDTQGSELTDGEISRGFGDGKTVGWSKWSGVRDVTVLVDLGATRPFEAVAAHLQGGGYAAIEFPERVAVSVSEDGKKWTRVAVSGGAPAATESHELGGMRCALGWLSLPTTGARGRYVKCQFVPKGWLMLSEIRVVSGGANVAAHQPYSIQSQPTGEETYADNAGLLTDGFYAQAGSGWKACAGFDQADPTVVADLGAVYRIGVARVHVQGGGPGGVCFPSKVSVSTSVDSQTWRLAGETAEHPSEENKTAAAAFMGVTFEPREARFVRFRIQKHGWAMLDEIEVFPAR